MKGSSRILFFALCFFVSQQNIYAKESNFRLLKNKKAVTIPFKFINKNIIIPLTINQSDTLFFMLDSGLTHTLITQLFPEDSLQLNNVAEETIKGLGGNATLSVVISYDNEINLNGIAGKHQRINFIKEDIFNLSQLAGHKINGIIGYDFLKHFITKIDYRRHLITFYEPKKYRKRLRNYLRFPMEIIAGKPYIKTTITAPDGQQKELKLMLDTGASLSLWVMDNNGIQITKPPKTISTYLGQGLSGKIHGEYGRIPALHFQSKTIKNVLAAYPTPEDVSAALTEGRNGSIGSEILRRFHIVMDYSGKQLFLKPNTAFKAPFSFNLSGIELYQPNLKIPIYKVFALRENSIASQSGLEIGDVILEINGQQTLLMTFDKLLETFDKLEKRKGKEVKLLIQRDTAILKVKYKIPGKNLI